MSSFELPLFPEFKTARFVAVDLDSEARRRQGQTPLLVSPRHLNPFLDPATCNEFVAAVAHAYGADFTFGGYLEDRRFLWNKSYLDSTKHYLHLGIDFNVPSGTKVASLFTGEVVRIDDDHPTEGGWGPRIIVRPKEDGPICIFAHLTEIRVKEGDLVRPGDILASVGRAPFNGNWYSHLHVQTVTREIFDKFLSHGLVDLDGYGDEELRRDLPSMYPNPLDFSWLVGDAFSAITK